MVVIVFRTRIRADADPLEMEKLGARMQELAASMPGFISYKDFAAADDEFVSLVEFESHETLKAWREHPEHRDAQRLGREKFFSAFRIQVCDPVRQYGFP